MLTGPREICPETLRPARAVDLLAERGEDLLPLSDGLSAHALLVISDSQAVVYLGSPRRQLERVQVVGDGAGGVTAVEVIVRNSQVSRSASGALLQCRGKKLLRVALFAHAGILAVARAVVEPDVSGKLLRSINRLR